MRWPEVALEALAQLSQSIDSAETEDELVARLLALLREALPQISWAVLGEAERGEVRILAGEAFAVPADWRLVQRALETDGAIPPAAGFEDGLEGVGPIVRIPGLAPPRLVLAGRGAAAVSGAQRSFVETAARLCGLAVQRRRAGGPLAPATLDIAGGSYTAAGGRWLARREPVQALFRSRAVGILLWHSEGRIEAANAAFLEMLGIRGDELEAGRVSWESLTPPEFAHLDARALAQMRERGDAEPYEKEFFHRDGRRVSVLLSAASYDRQGSEGIAIVVDVSESRRAEGALWVAARASETLGASLDYRTTLKSVARLTVPEMADWCLIFLVDEDGTVRLHEVAHRDPAKVQRIWDLSVEHALNRDAPVGPAQAIRTGRPQMISDLSPEVARGIPGSASDHAWLEALRLRSVMAVPLQAHGKVIGTMTFGWSESERHYGLRDLELAMDLSHRAGLAIDNARLYRQLEEAVRARDQFMAAASHELRTPTTTMRLLLQILRHDLPAAGAGEAGRHLHALERQVQRLAVLVERLLDVAQLGEGHLALKLEEVELAEVVERVLEREGERLERAGCPLDLQLDRSVRGRWDRERLELVVSSLLSNAVKFGAGKSVSLATGSRDGRAWLRVKDQGIGVPLEHHARIFQRFERAVSAQHYGGLGLGLWLVRQIVEAHGGQVQLDSAPSAGSTFSVELPLRREAGAARKQEADGTSR